MKNLAIIANMILLTIIAGLAVNLFWVYIGQQYQLSAAGLDESPTASFNATKQFQTLPHYAAIIQRDLFRTPQKAANAAVAIIQTESLETTDLNIKLWGTVTGKPEHYAVIETKGLNNRPQQQLFAEGDTVESAIIEQILDDKIILSHNGRRQMLMMEKFERFGRGAVYRRQPKTNRVQRRIIRRQTFENAVSNFNQLISQARVVPHNNGMLITAIKPNSIFRRMGLRNGDVITGVNNQTLRSMDDAMALYRSLKDDSSVSVQLQRRGKPQTFQYLIR